MQCNWCLKKQEEGKICSIDDDAQEILHHFIEADGVILATPVYFGRLSGHLASLIDRLRTFFEGRFYRGRLKDKVGGALAVAFIRHGGVETALLSILYTFLLLEMIPVNAPYKGALYGGGALSSLDGSGKMKQDKRHLILEDEWGLSGARALAKRMVYLIKVIKGGKSILENQGEI
jgi:multimeric flavodoxin WrbA